MRVASLLSLLFTVGTPRKPRGAVRHVLVAYAALVAGSVLYGNFVVFVQPWTLAALFMASVFALIFVLVPASGRAHPERPSGIDWLLCAASIAILIHFSSSAHRIVDRIPNIDQLTAVDRIAGTAFVLLALEATRRTTGVGLTIVVLIFMAYNFFGHRLDGVLGHSHIDLETFLDNTVFGVYGLNGVVARVAASYAFIFIMFGVLLTRSGGGVFFFNIAAALTGRTAGGPAKIAVVSSGLYGMISGSAVADVVTTGSITIPIMKRNGYTPEFAAAVETTASTGGSLMPPVMGAAAFVLVEYTGVPYAEVAFAALGPAVLYYLAVYFQLHFRAKRYGMGGLDGALIPRPSASIRDGGLFVVPLVSLIVAVAMGYTAIFAALMASISVLIVAALRPATRIGPVALYNCLGETTFRMVVITGAVAAAGLVIGGITMTGLAQKVSFLVGFATSHHLFLTLAVAAVVTLILGMGMPTVSAYILAAVLIGPILEELSIPKLPAHMFILYFAVLSALTPPVAVAAYAAAGLAEANPIKTAAISVRLGLIAFVVPFGFVFAPTLLLLGDPLEIALALVSAAFGVVLASAAIEGFLHTAMSGWARLVVGLAGVYMMVPLKPLWTAIGMAVILPLWAWHALATRRARLERISATETVS
jgi:TRAP transporter 4TM/12TM fusion protein